jgi:hypothetical protein
LSAAVTSKDVGKEHEFVADTLKLMLLQNTQECDLSLNWKLSDFVEEDRGSIC